MARSVGGKWVRFKSPSDIPERVPPGRYVYRGVRLELLEPVDKETFRGLVASLRELQREG